MLPRFLYLLLTLGITFSGNAQVQSAMTLNIRYDNSGDGENRWDNRRAELVELLLYYHPDVIGLQEGLAHQLLYIQDQLKEYKMIGVGREDGKAKGEFTAIFYDTTKLKLVKESTFWLSETPDKVSKGWDAALERICTYGLFEDKNGKRFWMFNAHYDHMGELARKNSSTLVVKKIAELNSDNLPVIVMGDLNSTPGEDPIQVFNRALHYCKPDGIYGPLGTFNSFDKAAPLEDRIDYIFYKNLRIKNYRHVDDKRKNGYWISDHLPVLAIFY